jgi:hypothetical protein
VRTDESGDESRGLGVLPLGVTSYVTFHAGEFALDVDVYLCCVEDAGGGRVTVQLAQNVEDLRRVRGGEARWEYKG